jgi:lysyl-tRNA synthetase class 2
VLVAGMLWLRRSSFRAASDSPPLWPSLVRLVLLAGTAVVAGTFTLEGSSWISIRLHHRHVARIGWYQAFLATIERMVGVRHVVLPDRLDDFFAPAMFAVTTGLVVVAAWMVFRPVVARRSRVGHNWGLERARDVVRRHGSGTLDYFALRTDKEFYFWGGTVVAHAVYGGVCLVSPDPVGPPSEREGAWRAFREYVDGRGWAIAVLGAGEDWLPIYRSTGMHDLYVGDEGVVRVWDFGLAGNRFKGLRQAVGRVARYGYTVSFHDPSAIEPALAVQLRDVMTKSRRGGAERGFSMTLGRVFDPADRGLLLAVVHAPLGDAPAQRGTGAHGPAVAFCQYVPAPAIKGYSLDLMRRDNGEHPNGLIDFAIVETVRYMAERGYRGLGLNFATMRAVLAGEAGDGVTQRVQGWLVRRMSGSMQIESLWRFNAKFDPDWQPRYAVYDSPENALPVALAVARAESFWELPLIGRFLVPSEQRHSEPTPAVP